MQIAIKRSIERVPGGMMVVPLLLGCLINTFWPGTKDYFGSFTKALFDAPLTVLAVFYVCMGATIEFSTTPYILKKGGALLATKILCGMLVGYILGHLIGAKPIESGFFAGLSTLAVVVAINDTNGGLYMALMQQYGKARDVAAYSIMSIESGPFLTMITLGVAGLSFFKWQTLVGAILPLALGMLLGNLDRDMRKFLGQAVPVMIPFFAFALGSTINLATVLQTGVLGVLLGLFVIVFSGLMLMLSDKLTGGNGVAGIAAATTAGNAAAVPAIVAAANADYADAAKQATLLAAASVVVTSLLVPWLTAWWAGRVNVPGDDAAAPTPASAAKS